MKNKVTKLSILGISAALAVIVAGCFVILTITQPSTIQGLQQFTAQMVVSVEGQSDATPHYGIVGVKVPNSWDIDSVWYTGGYSGHLTFLPPSQSDKEPGGAVDFWAQELETRYPSGDNMYWAVYESATSHLALVDTVDVTVNIKMTPGVTQGTFDLGYFVSNASLDFSDPTWYSIDLDNTITVSGVLPVELTSFTAAGIKDGVQLKWETASETNNKGFDIERSSDLKSFTTIGFVSGNGTTAGKSSYVFTDKNPAAGKQYYRLKQMDFNGTFEYSKIAAVDFSAPKAFGLSQNYPNPFNPATALSFSLPVESELTLSVYNSVGSLIEVVAQGKYQAGVQEVTFNASDLPSGIYYYTITAKGVDGSAFTKSAKMLLLK